MLLRTDILQKSVVGCPWTALRYFVIFLSHHCVPSLGFFPFCSFAPLRFQFFYLVYTRMQGFAFFFSGFVYYAITVCFLTCCLNALLSACYVIFTCLSQIVAFFFPLARRFSFLGYSLFYLSLYISCLIAVPYARVFLIMFWLPLGPDFCQV